MSGQEPQLRQAEHHIENTGPPSQVVICDFGAQTADLLYWASVDAGVRPELIDASRGQTPDYDYIRTKDAVIFSGSRESVNDEDAPAIPVGLGIPQLGICYGGQALAKAYGGEVSRVNIDGHDRGEFGVAVIDVRPEVVFYGAARKARVLMSHHDSITRVPPGFHITAQSGDIVASFASDDEDIIGTQFHPEVKDTEDGQNMIRRFLVDIAGIPPDPGFTLEVALDEYMEREEAQITNILERGDLIRGFLSGGVDSVVAARCIMRVAERLDRVDQVKFYYVDNGHMRVEDESIVDDMIAEGMPVEKIDASHEFFHTSVEIRLKDGTLLQAPPLVEADDPEVKRGIMGTIFYNISKRIIAEAQATTEGTVYFMQGTNASDIVESREVKSHHNVNAMEELREAGLLIEPLRHLLKYHIRYLAENRYNLPHQFASKQPFPGPGLGPRIVVNLKGSLERTDQALQERLDERIYNIVGNTITGHLVRMKTVGVKGDSRSVADAVFLSGEPDWRQLMTLAGEIPDFFNSINRIFYTPRLTIDRASIRGAVTGDNEKYTSELREMEEIHRISMLENQLDSYLSQHFVGALGVDLEETGLPLLGLRLFITGEKLEGMHQRRTGASRETFRTGVAAEPGVHVVKDSFNDHVATLRDNLSYHGAVAYDLTSKPPGSTEWE